MAPARPWGRTRARVGGVALTPRDTLELLCLARGAPADARPGAAMQRLRAEAAAERGDGGIAGDAVAASPESVARGASASPHGPIAADAKEQHQP